MLVLPMILRDVSINIKQKHLKILLQLDTIVIFWFILKNLIQSKKLLTEKHNLKKGIEKEKKN